jgi:hypothetical protein
MESEAFVCPCLNVTLWVRDGGRPRPFLLDALTARRRGPCVRSRAVRRDVWGHCPRGAPVAAAPGVSAPTARRAGGPAHAQRRSSLLSSPGERRRRLSVSGAPACGLSASCVMTGDAEPWSLVRCCNCDIDCYAAARCGIARLLLVSRRRRVSTLCAVNPRMRVGACSWSHGRNRWQ